MGNRYAGFAQMCFDDIYTFNVVNGSGVCVGN